MILQALYEYYQRKANDPESRIAPEGWEWKPIPFIVDIDSNGNFLQLLINFLCPYIVLFGPLLIVPYNWGNYKDKSIERPFYLKMMPRQRKERFLHS